MTVKQKQSYLHKVCELLFSGSHEAMNIACYLEFFIVIQRDVPFAHPGFPSTILNNKVVNHTKSDIKCNFVTSGPSLGLRTEGNARWVLSARGQRPSPHGPFSESKSPNLGVKSGLANYRGPDEYLNNYVVAIRGTDTATDLVEDLYLVTSALGKDGPFQQAMDALEAEVNQILAEHATDGRVIYVGYSLGASKAEVLCLKKTALTARERTYCLHFRLLWPV